MSHRPALLPSVPSPRSRTDKPVVGQAKYASSSTINAQVHRQEPLTVRQRSASPQHWPNAIDPPGAPAQGRASWTGQEQGVPSQGAYSPKGYSSGVPQTHGQSGTLPGYSSGGLSGVPKGYGGPSGVPQGYGASQFTGYRSVSHSQLDTHSQLPRPNFHSRDLSPSGLNGQSRNSYTGSVGQLFKNPAVNPDYEKLDFRKPESERLKYERHSDYERVPMSQSEPYRSNLSSLPQSQRTSISSEPSRSDESTAESKSANPNKQPLATARPGVPVGAKSGSLQYLPHTGREDADGRSDNNSIVLSTMSDDADKPREKPKMPIVSNQPRNPNLKPRYSEVKLPIVSDAPRHAPSMPELRPGVSHRPPTGGPRGTQTLQRDRPLYPYAPREPVISEPPNEPVTLPLPSPRLHAYNSHPNQRPPPSRTPSDDGSDGQPRGRYGRKYVYQITRYIRGLLGAFWY